MCVLSIRKMFVWKDAKTIGYFSRKIQTSRVNYTVNSELDEFSNLHYLLLKETKKMRC